MNNSRNKLTLDIHVPAQRINAIEKDTRSVAENLHLPCPATFYPLSIDTKIHVQNICAVRLS